MNETSAGGTETRPPTGDGGPGRHGHGVEAEQEADGLRRALRTAQVEGDGSDQGDEATVEEAQHQRDDDQPGERVGQRQQHGAHSDGQERSL